MTEIRLNGEAAENSHRPQNQQHHTHEEQHVNNAEPLRGTQLDDDNSENGENPFISSHISNRPQYPTKVVVKDSSFLDPIYRLLGFQNKNSDNEYECTVREIGTLIMLAFLLVAFFVSTTGFFVMWFTDVYNNQFTSKLILTNNSMAAEWWIKPPLSTHLKVHIFNYTNLDDFLSGKAKKLKVTDLGPYTYSENATKTQVQFNKNSTVTFRVNRRYTFMPEYSTGKQYDQVTVPNVPFITVLDTMKRQSYFVRMATKIGVESASPKLFNTVAADSLLWGYTDPLVEFIHAFKPFENGKFGLLVNRNGTSKDIYQIYTGESDIKKLGIISEFNGQKKMNFWSTESCNKLDGTDGSQFPPYLMDKKKRLEVFIPAMCRKLPLEYDSEVNLFEGVPAWRYKTPASVFAHPNINPENQCFCHIETGVCSPSGVFNGTLCYDAPVYVSFPHFYGGDPVLYQQFDGIKPDSSLHQTYADIHPRLAFPIGGASRIQINVQLDDFEFYGLKKGAMKRNIILPVMWLEVTSGEINDELRAMIYHSTFSANAIQLALKTYRISNYLATYKLENIPLLAAAFQGSRNHLGKNSKQKVE
ncbi:unnamed protein product [Hermetia illucens]|uniref:Scavenger receptor class B member 1 n=1 Tax=Hermetia illucens TaxID=343691 RepID=A0A7R8UEG4_HERIL|nr:unnamed protein product [Hermetia illucens]